jgi:hypothetical protein
MTIFVKVADRIHRAFRIASMAGCALTALGCGDSPEQGAGSVVQATDEIINGTAVLGDTIGTPVLISAEKCSGTLIRSNWIVSAKHCFTWANGRLAEASEVLASIQNGPNQTAIRIVRHPSLDVAAVQFPGPFTDAAGRSFVNPLYVGSDATLASQSVYMQGWGWSAYTSCSPPAGSGIGLRSWTAPITEMTPDLLSYRILGTGGKVPFVGDSGTTPFFTVAGLRRPTGVLSYVECTPDGLQITGGVFTRSDAFRGWLQGVVGAGATGGPISGFERSDSAVTSVAYTAGATPHVKVLSRTPPGFRGGVLWSLADLGGAPRANSDVPAYVRHDGSSVVLYGNTSDHIIQLFKSTGSSWVTLDLNAQASAPAMAAGGHFAAYVRNDNADAVVYPSADGHIRELIAVPGAFHWAVHDILPAGAPTGSRPVGFVRGDQINTVVYVDAAGHLQELTLWGSTWIRTDQTLNNGVPTVIPNGGVHVYARSDGFSALMFRDITQDIWELAMHWDGWWLNANLTALFGCPKALEDPYGFVRADGAQSVVYKGTDSHVWELSLNGGWACNDLTGPIGAADIGGAPPYGFISADNKTHVVYRSADGHVRDLVQGGSTWLASDLTALAGGP